MDPPVITKIIEGEEMEEGYTSSALADLRIRLGKTTDQTRSISMALTLLTTKGALNKTDVIDRGIKNGLDLLCFTMSEVFGERVFRTISGLQELLNQASELIPE